MSIVRRKLYMNTITTLHQNLILAALPEGELARLAPHLELVQLKSGESIFEPNVPMQYVYFPTTAIISQLSLTEDGSSTEIAVVGKEGVVGISVSIGSKTTSSCATVQSSGFAYRLSGRRLKQEFFRVGPVQQQLVKYTQALLTQMTHSHYL